MKNDKKWLKEKVQAMIDQEYRCYDPLIQQRKHTCRIIMDLIDQLEEPQKPVIPQFAADYIEKWKHEGLIMQEWFTFDHDDEDEHKVAKWLYDNDYEEKTTREHLLIDAIRYGYEVEKEKKYRVRAGNRYVRFNLDGSIIGVKKDNSIVCLERLSKLPFDYKKAVESGIITLEEVTE